MAKALGLAAPTVRRHLDILQRDQLVSWAEAKRRTGRPHYVFSLTDSGHERLPRQYDRLAGLLLRVLGELGPQDIAGQDGPQVLQLAMSRVGEVLADEYRGRVQGPTLDDRVRQVTQVLAQESLTAECSMDKDARRIRCFNCSFLRVATAYPVVCTAHQAMVASLLATEVRREESQALGQSSCTYVVPRAPSGKASGGAGARRTRPSSRRLR